MDLLRILDAKPEPCIVDVNHFKIDPEYQNSNIYKIATPMSDFQKELVDQIISLHYSDILRFFEKLDNKLWYSMNESRKEIIITSLETMISNIKLVCLHPYLLINHFFPKSLTTRDLPNRLAETSGKFQILNDLLIQLDSIYNPIDKNDKSKKGKNIDIAIIVRSGKAMDLVDALCIGHRCNLKKYSGIKLRDSSANQKKNLNLNLNIHLFPSEFENLNEKEISTNLNNFKKKMNFIIYFDSNIDQNNQFLNKLIDFRKTKFFQLIPIYSVEHIELYFQNQTNSRSIDEYLRPITAAVVVLRDRVGQLPSNLKPAYTKNLIFIKDYFSNPLINKWPLPDLPPIRNFNSKDVERSLLTEVKFNFDNEEILKEEEENRQDIKESFNSYFGGKTKMINHIIQPRFSKKNPIIQNYYQNKRLEKNYLMNPLNKDYENLTGISKQVSQNEITTHTLIYQFDTTLTKTIKINEEIDSFKKFNNIRIKNFDIMIETYEKLDNELKENEEKLKLTDDEINEITFKTEIIKNEIKDYNDNIQKLKDSSIDSNNSENQDVLKNFERYELLEEIKKLQGKLDSNKNENKYMKEEIERAEKSTIESESQIIKLKESNEELYIKIEDLKNDNTEINKEENILSSLKNDLKKSENEISESKKVMEELLANLNEIGHRSRHLNYSSRNK